MCQGQEGNVPVCACVYVFVWVGVVTINVPVTIYHNQRLVQKLHTNGK